MDGLTSYLPACLPAFQPCLLACYLHVRFGIRHSFSSALLFASPFDNLPALVDFTDGRMMDGWLAR